jgi:hypothetical protein
MVIFRFKGVKRLNPLQGIWHLLADKLIRVANIYQHAGDFSTCLWATSLWPYFTFFIFSSKNSAFLLYIYILKGVLVKSMNHDWNPLKSQIFQVTLWIFSEIHWNPEFSIEIPNFPGQFVEKKAHDFGCFSPPFSNRRKAAEKALPVPWRCQFPSWIQKLDPFEIRSSMFIGNPYIWVWVKTLVPSEPQNSW